MQFDLYYFYFVLLILLLSKLIILVKLYLGIIITFPHPEILYYIAIWSWFLAIWSFDAVVCILLKVVIEGFKSYKEQLATETFSPKVNCVGNNIT